MVESHFLSVLQSFLEGLALSLAPKSIGAAEPIASESLPALVLSLEVSRRPAPGLGEGASLIRRGALPWQARIDLSRPFLAEDASFSLLNDDRSVLVLPHGGLVQKQGATGALGPDDFSLRVDGTQRSIVASNPTGLEISVDPAVGRVTFGSPLPASGSVDVNYVLGQWERRAAQLTGTLRVDLCAANVADARALGDVVLVALGDDAARAVAGLSKLHLASLGSIGGPELVFGNCRRQSARFTFEYEQLIDRPDSSGGVIRHIPIESSFEQRRPE